MEASDLKCCMFCAHHQPGFCRFNPAALKVDSQKDCCGHYLADLESIFEHFNDELSWAHRRIGYLQGPNEADLKYKLRSAEMKLEAATKDVERAKSALDAFEKTE